MPSLSAETQPDITYLYALYAPLQLTSPLAP